MSDPLRSHPSIHLIAWRIIASLLNYAQKLVQVHLLVRGVVRIGSSLAAILDRLTHLVLGLLESDCFRMALGRERDVCILTMLVVGSGCARIQTALLHHQLACSVQISMTASQSAIGLVS